MKIVEEENEFDPYEITGKYKASRKIKIKEDNKKEIKKVENKKIIKKEKGPRDTLELILCLVFIILLLVTVVLGIKVVKARKTYKEHVKANIVVPVLGTGVNNEISVDLSKMNKNDERTYSFKVSNTKEEDTNKEEVQYNLFFITDANVVYEVYKNDEKVDLQEDKSLVDNTLAKDEEQVDTYTLKIKANKKISENKLLTIKIAS